MQTETHSINDVLAKNATSFFIPPFQRAYAWGRTEIERYFSDIIRIINSELDSNQKDKLEHFFGTVVIKEEKSGFCNKSIIVDGQQRLTTTLIFLIALRDAEDDPEKKAYITSNYLTNNTSTFQDKIKLKQVTKDWESYRSLVNKKEVHPGIIKNAYEKFSQLIADEKKKNPQIQLEHYITAIQRINVAVIFLDERPFKGEDPQIIFETLNSLGKPLTLSDLIRNYVLLNMDSSSQSDIYEKSWYPKIELPLQQESASDFFRDFLQYKTATPIKAVSDNNTKEIYQAFKNYVEKNYVTHKDFIDDILQYVKPYKFIITEKNTDTIATDIEKDKIIKELLRNVFHDIKSEAFKPFVMGLLFYHQDTTHPFSDDLLISNLEIIRTYLIRRRVVKLAQGENKSIVLFCDDRIKQIVASKKSLLELLSGNYYKMRLPNDDEIRTTLQNLNFYDELKQYSKFILGKMEERNTKVSVDFRNTKITIEHVMPQTLSDRWKNDLGADFEAIHAKYLHSIGNLILTEFNSEIGNNSFSEKKTKLNTSSLNYRLDIVNQAVWDEKSILQHQEKMIDCFLETFPLPVEYQKSSNWNTKEKAVVEFSPLDEDAGDLAEGNKPAVLIIDGEEIEVSYWKDVFIEFIKFLKNSEEFDFQVILDNQTGLFGRVDVFITWSALKKELDEDVSLSRRYKTLDDQFWDKVKDLTGDVLFVHTHISASACMSRVARIMDKFNMQNDFVRILLK